MTDAAMRIKDVTGALRSRRFRAKKKLNGNNGSVTVEPVFDAASVTVISTSEMCSLAARIGDGRASPDDMRVAERLILALVDRLPADSTIEIEPAADLRT